jgi:tetratricopeptide (TPR) repeat protein
MKTENDVVTEKRNDDGSNDVSKGSKGEASAACLKFKNQGNAAIKKKDYQKAIDNYTLALKEECGEQRHKILTNRANALLKLSNKMKNAWNPVKYIDHLKRVVEDANESSRCCGDTWWKAYQCLGLAKSRMFQVEAATAAFTVAIRLIKEDLPSSKKTQASVNLVEKNMNDMNNIKGVVIEYVNNLTKILKVSDTDLASLSRIEYFDYVFELLCSIDNSRSKWPKGNDKKIVRELNTLIRIYQNSGSKDCLSKDLLKTIELLKIQAKEQKIPALKLLIEDNSFGAPVDMRPQGMPMGGGMM